MAKAVAARIVLFLLTALAGFAVQAQPGAAAGDGADLFKQHCESCHGGKVAKAPPVSLLQIMSASSVLRAMEHGVMQEQAAGLTPPQRRLVAEHLTGQKLGDAVAVQPAPQCTQALAAFDFDAPPDALGWGVSHDNRRYFSPEMAGLEASDLPRLELKWAFAFPDAIRARSQPATGGGALYIGSQNGTVYALEQTTGCIRWSFSTVAEVRTGIVLDALASRPGGQPAAVLR